MWERETRSEYIDLEPLFDDGLIPELTDAIDEAYVSSNAEKYRLANANTKFRSLKLNV